jgi:hypothetical protein
LSSAPRDRRDACGSRRKLCGERSWIRLNTTEPSEMSVSALPTATKVCPAAWRTCERAKRLKVRRHRRGDAAEDLAGRGAALAAAPAAHPPGPAPAKPRRRSPTVSGTNWRVGTSGRCRTALVRRCRRPPGTTRPEPGCGSGPSYRALEARQALFGSHADSATPSSPYSRSARSGEQVGAPDSGRDAYPNAAPIDG